MSTDQYTPDELALLDKALLAAMSKLLADPNMTENIAAIARRNATTLLNERRSIRCDAVSIDKTGASALRSIRSRFEAIVSGTIGDTARINVALVFKVIDEAIAELAPLANNELAVHEFVCDEDMIRGAFFWEGGLTDMCGGIQVEYNSNEGIRVSVCMQKQLKLNAGDIVEIRVIERADR